MSQGRKPDSDIFINFIIYFPNLKVDFIWVIIIIIIIIIELLQNKDSVEQGNSRYPTIAAFNFDLFEVKVWYIINLIS